jgi:hypothetical protein
MVTGLDANRKDHDFRTKAAGYLFFERFDESSILISTLFLDFRCMCPIVILQKITKKDNFKANCLFLRYSQNG